MVNRTAPSTDFKPHKGAIADPVFGVRTAVATMVGASGRRCAGTGAAGCRRLRQGRHVPGWATSPGAASHRLGGSSGGFRNRVGGAVFTSHFPRNAGAGGEVSCASSSPAGPPASGAKPFLIPSHHGLMASSRMQGRRVCTGGPQGCGPWSDRRSRKDGRTSLRSLWPRGPGDRRGRGQTPCSVRKSTSPCLCQGPTLVPTTTPPLNSWYVGISVTLYFLVDSGFWSMSTLATVRRVP